MTPRTGGDTRSAGSRVIALPSLSSRAVTSNGPVNGMPGIITWAGPTSNSTGKLGASKRCTASGGPRSPPPALRTTTNSVPRPASTPAASVTAPRIGRTSVEGAAVPGSGWDRPAAGGAPPNILPSLGLPAFHARVNTKNTSSTATNTRTLATIDEEREGLSCRMSATRARASTGVVGVATVGAGGGAGGVSSDLPATPSCPGAGGVSARGAVGVASGRAPTTRTPHAGQKRASRGTSAWHAGQLGGGSSAVPHALQ